MGDSETVVAQTNAVMGYPSAAYTTTGYSDPSSNIAQEPTTEISAPVDASHPMLGDGNAYSVDSDSVMQESHTYATYEAQPAVGVTDAGGNVASSEHETMASTQAASYDASANGVATSGVGTVSSVGNGDASDNMEVSVDTQQVVDGSGMCFLHFVSGGVTIDFCIILNLTAILIV